MTPTMSAPAYQKKPVPSIEEVVSEAKRANVKLIRLQFVDIHGVPKNLSVPVGQLESALNNELMLDGSSIAGFRTIETSDMFFWPDRATFKVLPWTEGDRRVARIFCDIYNPDGTPFEGCPRNNLKRVLNDVAAKGYVYNVGPELEFFLFKRSEDGEILLETHDTAGYFDLAPDDLGEQVREEVVGLLDELGFDVEADHHEVAQGQHEIDFKYADALTVADNVMTLKTVVKWVARRHGLHATFMAKPVEGINGSGMHVNQSLSTLDGTNVFKDDSTEFKLSENALNYIGGVLKHVRATTAVTNPTINSYKRLVPGYEAPVYVAWSPLNRSALCRVPAKRGNATRMELRSPDPTCNPYLAFACLVTAGLDGIENKVAPPAPVITNIYRLSLEDRKEQGVESLPGSLYEALQEFKQNKICKQALGDHIFQEFLQVKEMEWKKYSSYVSPWELEQYLARF